MAPDLPKPIRLSDLCPHDDLTVTQFACFMDNRGGCRCWMSPPCSACTEPVTADELRAVGFEDFIDDTDPNAEMIARDAQPRAERVPVVGTPRLTVSPLATIAPIPKTGFSLWGVEHQEARYD